MKISIIIPIFNNADSLPELFKRLEQVASKSIFNGHIFQLLLVNDGSKDHTAIVLKQLVSESNLESKIISLTKNFGSYNAFLAGMTHANGTCNVHLHADLQDPPELIPQLFHHYLNGYKLVIANRKNREDASLFSSIYHFLVKKFAIHETPPGGFDLILFDEKIRQEIVSISEKHTNNVYLINWLGYEYVNIPYKRVKRKHGKSQWAFWKKVHLFIDTFFSFSNIPLTIIRISFYLSILFFLASSLLVILHSNFSFQSPIFLISLVLLFCGVNFVIVGEFLSRIHETVRNRPNFVVQDVYEKP